MSASKSCEECLESEISANISVRKQERYSLVVVNGPRLVLCRLRSPLRKAILTTELIQKRPPYVVYKSLVLCIDRYADCLLDHE
jgi:hypothetical protein